MTTSKKFRLGLGTMLVLLGLCALTLLVRWPSTESLNADPSMILRDTQFSFGLALVLLVAAGASARGDQRGDQSQPRRLASTDE